MTTTNVRLAGRTVRRRLTLVNTLLSMDNHDGAEGPEDAPGRRLERFVKAHWERRDGGILKLAEKIGSSTETIYAWFRGDNEPSMAHLRAIADLLGVRRSVLVAVLDGDPVPVEGDRLPDALEGRLRAIEAALALQGRPAGEERPAQSAPHARAG